MVPSQYFKTSSHRFYGAVVAFVMLLSYEVLIIWENTSGSVIRNAPEAWLRNALNFAGVSHYYVSFLMVTVSIILIPLFYRSEITVNKRIFLYIIGESIFLGVISGFVIQFVITNLFFLTGSVTGSIVRDIGLAVGAGLFEELFFRVILTTLIIKSASLIIPKKWLAIFTAVLISSFLFSLAHYVGNLSDSFEIYSFLFRFFAGLWFTTLYSIRGFAVVCLTHAFYDIFVLLF